MVQKIDFAYFCLPLLFKDTTSQTNAFPKQMMCLSAGGC